MYTYIVDYLYRYEYPLLVLKLPNLTMCFPKRLRATPSLACPWASSLNPHEHQRKKIASTPNLWLLGIFVGIMIMCWVFIDQRDVIDDLLPLTSSSSLTSPWMLYFQHLSPVCGGDVAKNAPFMLFISIHVAFFIDVGDHRLYLGAGLN